MTTPERLRRRQLTEGAILIVLAILMVAQAIYFNQIAQEQKNCIATNFAKLSASYTQRAQINTRDSDVKTAVITAVAKATSEAQIKKALHRFLVDQTKINLDRAQHPVPPFPVGDCQS